MSLSDEIATIRDRAIARMNDAHDYYAYTADAWASLRRAVTHGNATLSWRNVSTRSTVNEQSVLALAQRYVRIDLTSSTLLQFVSIFENFLFDAIRAWLLAYPERLSKRQLSGKEILELPDKAAIIDALVAKELRDVFYDRPANWFEYLKALVNISSPSPAEAEQFAEIKATRDVLVHGQGIANAYYADKAGKAARTQAGQPLDVPAPYHQQSWELLRTLVLNIGTEMADRA